MKSSLPSSADSSCWKRLRLSFRSSSSSEPESGYSGRSEEHTSELQSLMRISYAVFCLKKKNKKINNKDKNNNTIKKVTNMIIIQIERSTIHITINKHTEDT